MSNKVEFLPVSKPVKEAAFLKVKGLLYSWLLIMCLPSEVGCLIDICKPSTVCICILEHHSGRTRSKKNGGGLILKMGLFKSHVSTGRIRSHLSLGTYRFFSPQLRDEDGNWHFDHRDVRTTRGEGEVKF